MSGWKGTGTRKGMAYLWAVLDEEGQIEQYSNCKYPSIFYLSRFMDLPQSRVPSCL